MEEETPVNVEEETPIDDQMALQPMVHLKLKKQEIKLLILGCDHRMKYSQCPEEYFTLLKESKILLQEGESGLIGAEPLSHAESFISSENNDWWFQLDHKQQELTQKLLDSYCENISPTAQHKASSLSFSAIYQIAYNIDYWHNAIHPKLLTIFKKDAKKVVNLDTFKVPYEPFFIPQEKVSLQEKRLLAAREDLLLLQKEFFLSHKKYSEADWETYISSTKLSISQMKLSISQREDSAPRISYAGKDFLECLKVFQEHIEEQDGQLYEPFPSSEVNIEKMQKFLEVLLKSQGEAFYKENLTDREQAWTKLIMANAESPNNLAISCGQAHIPGMLKLLGEQGFEVYHDEL